MHLSKKLLSVVLICTSICCTKPDEPNNNTNTNIEQSFSETYNYTGTGNMSGFTFDAPQQWQVSGNSNEILISDQYNNVQVQPILQGTGNLENDASTFFAQVFAGLTERSDFVNLHYFERGKTKQHFPYYRVTKDVQNANGVNFRASILLVQLSGNRVALISNFIDADGAIQPDILHYLLFTFTIKNEQNATSTFLSDIIGGWSTVSTNIGVYHAFFKSGEFATGVATQFSTYIGGGWEEITTNNYSSKGKYIIKGNILNRAYDNGQISETRMRFYEKKTGYNDPYTKHLGSITYPTYDPIMGGLEYDKE
ncbi:MAG: hypothetical protein RL660_1987 [Bacteroidota bacterium]|jgi:hypothetical protein